MTTWRNFLDRLLGQKSPKDNASTGVDSETLGVRRRHPRVAEPIRTLIFWRNVAGRHDGYMVDLSLGGCYINTSAEAVIGEAVMLEIPSPDDSETAIEIAGKAVEQHRRLIGFGVQFDQLDERQRKVLNALLTVQ